jgi:hypothetical protein
MSRITAQRAYNVQRPWWMVHCFMAGYGQPGTFRCIASSPMTPTPPPALLTNTTNGPIVSVVLSDPLDANFASAFVKDTLTALAQQGWLAEVIVVTKQPGADAAAAATIQGARVLFESTPALPAAWRSGIAASLGEYVVVVDAAALGCAVDIAAMLQVVMAHTADVAAARRPSQPVATHGSLALAFSKATAETLELAASGAEFEAAVLARAHRSNLRVELGTFGIVTPSDQTLNPSPAAKPPRVSHRWRLRPYKSPQATPQPW